VKFDANTYNIEIEKKIHHSTYIIKQTNQQQNITPYNQRYNTKMTSSPEEIECKTTQDSLRAMAKSAVFEKKGTTTADLYKQARQIDLEWDKQRMLHKWDSVYYTLFLYLEIALRYNLHKKTEKLYVEQATIVKNNLLKVEDRVKIASKGMLYQRINKEKFAAIVAAATGGSSSSSLISPTSQSTDNTSSGNSTAKDANTSSTVTSPSTDNVGSMSLEEMRAAVDALRMPGTKPASLSSLAVVAAKPVMGTLLDGNSAPSNGSTTTTSTSTPPLLPPKPAHLRMGIMEDTSQDTTTLALKPVMGDGNCAFRAIAQGRSHGTLTFEQETHEALELRRIVTKLLARKGDEEMVGTGMTIRQVVMMKENVSSYEAYVQGMSRSDYAGETEFWLLAEELGLRIAIFINGDDQAGLVHMITYGTNESCPLICLLWQRGKMSEMGNHYDALIPEESS
jgi:hypothetical protein